MADEGAVATIVEPAAAAVVTPTWRDSLPDDLKADKYLSTVSDVPTLAKNYVEAQKLISTRRTEGGVTIPSDKATPEEIKAFRAANNIPATPGEYVVKAHPMQAHPQWNKEMEGAFFKTFHELHLPQSAAERIIHDYGNFMAAQVKSNDDLSAEARGELRKTWGVNYDANMGMANNATNRVAQAIGLSAEDMKNAFDGPDPAATARALAWFEMQFTEHGWISGEANRGVSHDDAVSRLAEMQKELLTVPQGSDQALAIIEKISNMGRALRAA